MPLPLVAAALLAQSLSVSIAAAPRVAQFHYHFDSPSSFDTSAPVPHNFEQRYDVIPRWFSAEARYRAGEVRATTSAAFSLSGRTHGSDIDTFLQPSGDVVTSGTNGDVTLRSWEVSQRLAVPTSGGWSVGVSAGLRHDHAEFFPDDIIVTHTMPVSITRTFTSSREFTTSQALSIGIDAERDVALSDRWHLQYGAGVVPLIRAELTVQLPDKYPGVDLSFVALSFGATGHLSVERLSEHWRAGIALSGSGAWRYRSTSAFGMRGVTLAASVGLRLR